MLNVIITKKAILTRFLIHFTIHCDYYTSQYITTFTIQHNTALLLHLFHKSVPSWTAHTSNIVYANNFWLNFDVQVVRVSLYADHATQPESTVNMSQSAICQ